MTADKMHIFFELSYLFVAIVHDIFSLCRLKKQSNILRITHLSFVFKKNLISPFRLLQIRRKIQDIHIVIDRAVKAAAFATPLSGQIQTKFVASATRRPELSAKPSAIQGNFVTFRKWSHWIAEAGWGSSHMLPTPASNLSSNLSTFRRYSSSKTTSSCHFNFSSGISLLPTHWIE